MEYMYAEMEGQDGVTTPRPSHDISLGYVAEVPSIRQSIVSIYDPRASYTHKRAFG